MQGIDRGSRRRTRSAPRRSPDWLWRRRGESLSRIESVEHLERHQVYTSVTPEKAVSNVIKALGKGVLKVMSKMGVSTVASYTGAQIFEALGLSREVVDRYFTGTTSKLGGVTLEQIAEEVRKRHLTAYPLDGIPLAHRTLPVGGE